VLEISAPPTSRRRQDRPAAGRGRFGVLGDAKLAGLIGLVGLVLALIGVVIAFLSWRGDEQDRAANTPSTATAPATATVPATANASTMASASTAAEGTTATERRTPTSIPKPAARPAQSAGLALSYRLDATALGARTVKVTTTPTGRPESGETYWLILEVNWGDGNTDYYPRRRLGDQAEKFDVSIPADARTDVVRTGRVYALDAAQSADAEVRLGRQSSTTNEDDFFTEPTGKAVSDGERLVF
jgi:hypothetical protein